MPRRADAEDGRIARAGRDRTRVADATESSSARLAGARRERYSQQGWLRVHPVF
jgi:hypothetical protein